MSVSLVATVYICSRSHMSEAHNGSLKMPPIEELPFSEDQLESIDMDLSRAEPVKHNER